MSHKKSQRKTCFEANYDARGTYNANSQIKLKATMLNSSLCEYSDA